MYFRIRFVLFAWFVTFVYWYINFMEPIIEIKNIGKRYDITSQKQGYIALRDIVGHALRHPIESLIEKAKNIFGKNGKQEYWALRDINLNINKGEIVGIIGRNGAGKSTLLKILTGITPPTLGEIKLTGKVSSLLEVGTGFHPELTGRENIFLNGAILGMSKKEIIKKFDQIVQFSGVEQFIDTPVKRYSSGMYVRLAFSIVAHLEPDILLVDEVLAVGDAEFQKKCLGKMSEVTQTANRTVLFVSHDMSVIQKLCAKTILLDKGKVVAFGNTREVVERYLSDEFQSRVDTPDLLPIRIDEASIAVHNFTIIQDGVETNSIDSDRPFEININYELLKDLIGFEIGLRVRNLFKEDILWSFSDDWCNQSEKTAAGKYGASITFPEAFFAPGTFYFVLDSFQSGKSQYLLEHNVHKTIHFSHPKNYKLRITKGSLPEFIMRNQWKIKSINPIV